MKIIITEPDYFPKDLLTRLEKVGTVVARKLTHDELVEESADADILIVRVETKVDSSVIDGARNLKAIATMTTGFDHIDMKRAEQRGIKILSMPGYATTATAEYTMSLIMSLMRKIPFAYEHLKREKWARHRFLGSELQGKTLGVFGFGKIGSRVGKYAKAFGMDVIFFDPFYDEKKSPVDYEARRVGSLDELLEKSDVLTLHAFLSKETQGVMNASSFGKMKSTAVIVNASRGAIIDDPSLIHALERGTIAGAALDVFDEEPLPTTHPLVAYARAHDNLILTPHIAGSTMESIETAARFVTEKIEEEFG